MGKQIEYSTPKYKVSTPVFQGPLDLLLHLIEKEELDITRLALAQVTDQYLEYIKEYQDQDVENISEFVVIAARLLQIKSSVLLPQPSNNDKGEEDLGDQLARQLIQYRRYKMAANWLENRSSENLRSYIRLFNTNRVERKADLSQWSIEDLRKIAYNALLGQPGEENLGEIITQPRVTIREKIKLIIQRIKTNGLTTFSELIHFSGQGHVYRLHVVVSFLAMLELVKRRRVQTKQSGLFSDIVIQPAEEWDEQEDVMELEFGE